MNSKVKFSSKCCRVVFIITLIFVIWITCRLATRNREKASVVAKAPDIQQYVKELASVSTRLESLPNFNGTIYMDWTLDSDMFSYINYKSLESVLFTYPAAKIVISTIA